MTLHLHCTDADTGDEVTLELDPVSASLFAEHFAKAEGLPLDPEHEDNVLLDGDDLVEQLREDLGGRA